MEYSGIMGGVSRAAEWIWKLAYVNLIWIFFSLCGLVVFGIFPSTIGLFTVVRKWMMGETDLPVFKTYWAAFKGEFVKGNIVGFIFGIIGCILYADLRYFESFHSPIFLLLSYLFIALFVIFGLTLMYFFPVYVHFNLKKFQYISHAFLLMLLHPFYTILMLLGGLFVYFVMFFLSGLIPFFSVSSMAIIIMFAAIRVFKRLEKKVERVG